MTVPVATITAAGCTVPPYADCLAYFTDGYRGIYGADIDLDPDTQDGQWIAIQALAMSQANDMCLSAYNAFSPATAQGAGLSIVVKINGIAREVSSQSTVDVELTGSVGTIITNGKIKDSNGNIWDLPASVTIPLATTITVTATCEEQGAIQAGPQTWEIFTPTRNWQTAISSGSASAGAPVETDAQLRERQAVSTALPAQSVIDGCTGILLNLPGVTHVGVDNNTTNSTDANGVPSHSVAYIVEGGDAQTIADTILAKKGPGAGTYGTTTETSLDAYGIPHTIRFYRPTLVPITVEIDITALANYTTEIGDEIVAAVVAAINGLTFDEDVLYRLLYVPAQLYGPYAAPAAPTDPDTFKLTAVRISKTGPPAAADVAIAFNERATCITGAVTLTVT